MWKPQEMQVFYSMEPIKIILSESHGQDHHAIKWTPLIFKRTNFSPVLAMPRLQAPQIMNFNLMADVLIYVKLNEIKDKAQKKKKKEKET